MHSNTCRSLVESMAWLISSTTRKGAGLMDCSEMRYTIVATERSPPESRPPSPSTCSDSFERHCTLMCTLYCAKSSAPSGSPVCGLRLRPSTSSTWPTHRKRSKYAEKLSSTIVIISSSLGFHSATSEWRCSRFASISACVSLAVPLAASISSQRFSKSRSVLPSSSSLEAISSSSDSISASSSFRSPGIAYHSSSCFCSPPRRPERASRSKCGAALLASDFFLAAASFAALVCSFASSISRFSASTSLAACSAASLASASCRVATLTVRRAPYSSVQAFVRASCALPIRAISCASLRAACTSFSCSSARFAPTSKAASSRRATSTRCLYAGSLSSSTLIPLKPSLKVVSSCCFCCFASFRCVRRSWSCALRSVCSLKACLADSKAACAISSCFGSAAMA
ncbi:hypothetical protein Ctob_001395 [Chrysochromulina tobinii]|uniref:Uncharacterized protein n=1 Tax=Chrysochromulina tobinii TaxID=1460289 RepID=A0A0M0JH07_9EUKA|nr:hypothetical protein Ctob_001395 [Chrysochromulina tobinii]|eukprot:KOO25869.1 hypothetical protein Ctob_001395 [Chrysochromulina sp. CCMP291]